MLLWGKIQEGKISAVFQLLTDRISSILGFLCLETDMEMSKSPILRICHSCHVLSGRRSFSQGRKLQLTYKTIHSSVLWTLHSGQNASVPFERAPALRACALRSFSGGEAAREGERTTIPGMPRAARSVRPQGTGRARSTPGVVVLRRWVLSLPFLCPGTRPPPLPGECAE